MPLHVQRNASAQIVGMCNKTLEKYAPPQRDRQEDTHNNNNNIPHREDINPQIRQTVKHGTFRHSQSAITVVIIALYTFPPSPPPQRHCLTCPQFATVCELCEQDEHWKLCIYRSTKFRWTIPIIWYEYGSGRDSSLLLLAGRMIYRTCTGQTDHHIWGKALLWG